jgi:hypothetical protein
VAKKNKVKKGVAFLPKSGIITTNLGKTATLTEIAGRERRVHHSKSLPLPSKGEVFFWAKEKFP